MATNPSANGPPPKPWEQVGSSSGPTPFKPPSPGSTSDVVEASGTAQPGEIVPAANRNGTVNTNTLSRPVPSRPWEQQQTYGSSYGGGYNSGMNYNSSYGSGMYGGSYGGLGGSYGGLGGSYGGGMYGNSMYRGGLGGMYGGSSMYGGGGGGMYGGGLGGPMGGYGMGMGPMGQYGNQDPNNPFGPPSPPPGFWVSFLHVMEGAVNFCGRIAMLIDQNTQAFHFFITAMLQLFDRSGMLYGELARFVFRMLGIKTNPRKVVPPGSDMAPGPHGPQNYIQGPKAAPSSAWDSAWGDGSAN